MVTVRTFPSRRFYWAPLSLLAASIQRAKSRSMKHCEAWKLYKRPTGRGPRVAHLSDKATADMEMLCNSFPILSSQLMKRSSFKQLLILKKNIWSWQSMEPDHLNKLSITFQQKGQCGIWWQSKWFLKNHDFIHVNSTVAGIYNEHKQDGGHFGCPVRPILAVVHLQVTWILPMNSVQ